MGGEIVVVRGGGDLATGVIQKFVRSGFHVLMLEIAKPTAIRRSVALCEAIYRGYTEVEDIHSVRISDISEMSVCFKKGVVPALVDPEAGCLAQLKPVAVIDAIIAKRNTNTYMGMAPVTIGLGPGFRAGTDVHAVIETMRGHDLGRLILRGCALPDTGMPGEVGGQSDKRVIHAPIGGEVRHIHQIGDEVEAGETICTVADREITAPFKGLLRGLLRDGLYTPIGMKIADVDPRLDIDWHTVSDKARCLGGAALEAYLYLCGVGAL